VLDPVGSEPDPFSAVGPLWLWQCAATVTRTTAACFERGWNIIIVYLLSSAIGGRYMPYRIIIVIARAMRRRDAWF
jgi:hypothetical protein